MWRMSRDVGQTVYMGWLRERSVEGYGPRRTGRVPHFSPFVTGLQMVPVG